MTQKKNKIRQKDVLPYVSVVQLRKMTIQAEQDSVADDAFRLLKDVCDCSGFVQYLTMLLTSCSFLVDHAQCCTLTAGSESNRHPRGQGVSIPMVWCPILVWHSLLAHAMACHPIWQCPSFPTMQGAGHATPCFQVCWNVF